MTSSKKIYLLSAGVAICLALVAILGYSTWSLHNQVKQLEASAAPPTSQPTGSLSPWLSNPRDWSSIWDNFGSAPKNFADIDQWLDQTMHNMLSGNPWNTSSIFSINSRSPKIEFEDNKKEYKAVVKIPEGQEVEVNTDITDGVLTISGKVKRSQSFDKNNVFTQSESISEFSQAIALTDPIDQAAMKVINKNGEIIVTVPKVHS